MLKKTRYTNQHSEKGVVQPKDQQGAVTPAHPKDHGVTGDALDVWQLDWATARPHCASSLDQWNPENEAVHSVHRCFSEHSTSIRQMHKNS